MGKRAFGQFVKKNYRFEAPPKSQKKNLIECGQTEFVSIVLNSQALE